MAKPDIEKPLTPEERDRLRGIFVGLEALHQRTRLMVLDIDRWRRATVSLPGHSEKYHLLIRLSDLHFEPHAITSKLTST
jgi:hypothetical protein